MVIIMLSLLPIHYSVKIVISWYYKDFDENRGIIIMVVSKKENQWISMLMETPVL